ncbi:hypothetical protein EDB84DRAFT_1271462, partial [Lactarius hengduanensis]
SLAYTFTNIKSQGQRLEYVIVDIAKPPSGSLTGFNAYVTLSRSRGRDTIRLRTGKNLMIFLGTTSTGRRKVCCVGINNDATLPIWRIWQLPCHCVMTSNGELKLTRIKEITRIVQRAKVERREGRRVL